MKYGITALTFDVYYNLLSLFYYSFLTVKKGILIFMYKTNIQNIYESNVEKYQILII